jgi:DNA-binding protein HU-beta
MRHTVLPDTSSVRSARAPEEPVNKAEFVAALERRLGSRKIAAEALEAVLDTITRTVARGEKVGITGFGSFEKTVRGPRIGRNPRTGESVKIKKTSVPRFRPGTVFKGYVADPKTLPKVAGASAKTAPAKTAKTAPAKTAKTAPAKTAKTAPARASGTASKVALPKPTPARRAAAVPVAKTATKRATKKS